MILLTHVVTGAAIGSVFPNPFVAVPLAFGSHFLLDMIPHVQAPSEEGYIPNKKTYIFVSIDTVFSLLFVGFLFKNNFQNSLIFASVGAVLPDIIDTTRYNSFFFKNFSYYYRFHDKIQNETTKAVGYISQIILIVLSLFLLGVL